MMRSASQRRHPSPRSSGSPRSSRGRRNSVTRASSATTICEAERWLSWLRKYASDTQSMAAAAISSTENRSSTPGDRPADFAFTAATAIDILSLGRRGNEWDGHPCHIPRVFFHPDCTVGPGITPGHAAVWPLAGCTADQGVSPLPRRLAIKNSSPAAPLPPNDSGNAVDRRLDGHELLSNHHRDALHLVVAHPLRIPASGERLHASGGIGRPAAQLVFALLSNHPWGAP